MIDERPISKNILKDTYTLKTTKGNRQYSRKDNLEIEQDLFINEVPIKAFLLVSFIIFIVIVTCLKN